MSFGLDRYCFISAHNPWGSSFHHTTSTSTKHRTSDRSHVLHSCQVPWHTIPSLLSTCLSILVVHLSSKIESLTYLTMQTIQAVPIWDYLKRARAALCFDFIRNIFWDTLSFWKHRSGYLKSLSWSHKMMIMVSSNDDHCINTVTSEIPIDTHGSHTHTMTK